MLWCTIDQKLPKKEDIWKTHWKVIINRSMNFCTLQPSQLYTVSPFQRWKGAHTVLSVSPANPQPPMQKMLLRVKVGDDLSAKVGTWGGVLSNMNFRFAVSAGAKMCTATTTVTAAADSTVNCWDGAGWKSAAVTRDGKWGEERAEPDDNQWTGFCLLFWYNRGTEVPDGILWHLCH